MTGNEQEYGKKRAGCSEEEHRGTEMMVRIDFVFDCLTV